MTHERATDNYQENIVAEEQRHRRRGRENIRGKPQRWPAEACGEAASTQIPHLHQAIATEVRSLTELLQFWRIAARRPAAAASRRAQRGDSRAQAEGVKRESGLPATFTFLDVHLPRRGRSAWPHGAGKKVPRSGTFFGSRHEAQRVSEANEQASWRRDCHLRSRRMTLLMSTSSSAAKRKRELLTFESTA